MGIKNFSKVFENQGEVKLKDLRTKTIVVDAMYQLHRTAHPFKTTQNATLTGPDGTATNHINGLLALIFNLKKCGAKQVWIFDSPDAGHDSLKDIEIERRRTAHQKAKVKLDKLLAHPILFSDDEDDSKLIEKKKEEHAVNKNKHERASFSLDVYMISDLKFILDSFNVPWFESPPGYEAEQLAACLTNNYIAEIKADAVLTPDPDCLLFGASIMIKNDKTKFYKYQLATILKDEQINQDDIIKIGVILGCDFADKTPGIGPATIMKKYKTVELSERQKEAVEYFKKPIDPKSLALIKWQSVEHKPFTDQQKIDGLFKWITEVKGFNIARTESRFKTAKIVITQ